MRWIFYSLLVINVVYLGVQLTKNLAEPSVVAGIPLPHAEGGTPLVLLAEQPQSRREARQAVASGSLCPVIGPWESESSARAGVVQLRAAGVAARVRGLSIEKDRLSWVYLPPYGSRERALVVLQELQDRGVDSFIVKEGDDANAISLGYFSSEESAEGLRVKMRNAGYPAFVRETSKVVTEYWAYLADSSAEEKPEVKVFLEANQSLKLDRVSCD